jgi:hypothetical protein
MAFQGKNDPEAYLEREKSGVNFFLSPLLWDKESKTYYYLVYWMCYYLVGSTCLRKEGVIERNP